MPNPKGEMTTEESIQIIGRMSPAQMWNGLRAILSADAIRKCDIMLAHGLKPEGIATFAPRMHPTVHAKFIEAMRYRQAQIFGTNNN